MKLPALTREQVRRVDQRAVEEYQMPSIVLMENAGRGAAEIIDRLTDGDPIVILCGAGNNGGDGYVIARHLELAHRQVRIVALKAPAELTGDAKTNAEIAIAAGTRIDAVTGRGQIEQSLDKAAAIVDAMLGTGATGDPRGLYADAIQLANDASDTVRIAIDIPTGLDCDSGSVGNPTFQSDHTVTFVASKIGFAKGEAPDYVGQIHEIGIGVPLQLLKQLR